MLKIMIYSNMFESVCIATYQLHPHQGRELALTRYAVSVHAVVVLNNHTLIYSVCKQTFSQLPLQ